MCAHCSPENVASNQSSTALGKVLKRAGRWQEDLDFRACRHLPDVRPGSVSVPIIKQVNRAAKRANLRHADKE